MLKKPKEKGRRAELEFAKMIVDTGLDGTAARMVMSGSILGLESDIFTKLPICFEVKNQETWSPLAYYRQAQAEKHIGDNKIPVVIMTKNHEGMYSFLKAQDFLDILVYAKKGGWPNEEIAPESNFHPVPKPQKRT